VTKKTSTTIAYYSTFIGLGLISAVLGPTLPALAELTQTSFSEISILFVVHSLGYFVGSLVGGNVLDRVSGHRAMALALIAAILFLVVIPVTPLLWLLAAIVFVTGFARGIVDVGGNTLLVWVHGENVGPYMNALHLFYGLGAFLAPMIIAQALMRSGGISRGYWLIAILLIPAIVQLSLISSPTADKEQSEHKGEIHTGQLVFWMALFLFCYSSLANIFGGWVYSYSLETKLADLTRAAYLTSLFWGAFTLGRVLSIPVAMRFQPQQILQADILGSLFSVGAMLMFPKSGWVIWIASAGLGLSVASMFPTIMSLAERTLAVSGKVTSRFVVASALGGMLPPWIVGQLFDTVGPKSVIWSVFAFLVVQGFVFFILMNRVRMDLSEEKKNYE
jgi:MFS transporter, FHS family, Na+ dependent glucose transporter 1